MKYADLKQRHPDYCADVWKELDDFYKGGYVLQANAERYLPRLVGEQEARYRERLRSAGYLAYFGQIVDYFAAALFTQSLTVATEKDAEAPAGASFYASFTNDADGNRTHLDELFRQAFLSALVKRRALVGVDLPRSSAVAPLTLADEERGGASRAYAMPIPIEQLVDWERDERGAFEWVILHRCIERRESPESRRGTVVEEFKVWRRSAEGRVSWELYRTAPFDPKKSAPRDDDEVPLVDGGVTSFRRIPLLELTLPEGLWVGNKVGPLAKEHFQRRTTLVAAEARSLVAIPVAKLGPEVGGFGDAMPADAAQDPHRGDDPIHAFERRGFVVLGKDDDLYFAEPEGKAYALVDQQLRDLKDEMFRVVHQMAASVSNTTGMLGRSGLSKVQDRAAEAIVLDAFGKVVRAFAVEVYTAVSEARGEMVTWVPYGLDTFDGTDRAEVLNEAVQLNAVGIPSRTFKVTYKTDLALKLTPNLPPETQAQIRKEIEAGVESEAELGDVLRSAYVANQHQQEAA